jgi:hypothetical protein
MGELSKLDKMTLTDDDVLKDLDGVDVKSLLNREKLNPSYGATTKEQFKQIASNDYSSASMYGDVGSPGVGDSRYDKFSYKDQSSPNELENTRSMNEPWIAKIGAGVAKFGTTTAITAVNGAASLLYGIPYAIANGHGLIDGFNKLEDNPVANALNSAQDEMEKLLPNYKSHYEEENPIKSMFTTANGWADLLKQAGFTVGSIYGGMPYMKALGLLSKIPKLAGVSKVLKPIVMDVVMADGEAVTEGRQNSEQWVDFQQQRIKDDCDRKIASIEQRKYMATTPEELKALDLEKQQAVADRDAKIQQVHNDKEKMAEMDYALNFPILMASNAITFGRQLTNGFASEKRMAQIMEEKTQTELRDAAGKGFGDISKSVNEELDTVGELRAVRSNNGVARIGSKLEEGANGAKKQVQAFYDAGGNEITKDQFLSMQSIAAKDPARAYDFAYSASMKAGKSEKEAIAIANSAKKEAESIVNDTERIEKAAVKKYKLKEVNEKSDAQIKLEERLERSKQSEQSAIDREEQRLKSIGKDGEEGNKAAIHEKFKGEQNQIEGDIERIKNNGVKYVDEAGNKLTRDQAILKFKKEVGDAEIIARKSKMIARTITGLSSGIKAGADGLLHNSRTTTKGILKLLSHPMSEGSEEVAQQVASDWAGNTYQQDVDDTNASNDPKAVKKAFDWYASATSTLGKTLKDTLSLSNSSTWAQFLAGAVMGLTGAPMFRRMHDKNGKRQSPIYLNGFVGWQARDYFKQKKDDDATVEKLNSILQDPKFKTRFQSVVRNIHFSDQKDEALRNDDKFNFDKAEDKQLLSDMVLFDNVGQLDLYETKIIEGSKELADNPVTDEDVQKAIADLTKTVAKGAEQQQQSNNQGQQSVNPQASKKVCFLTDDNGNTLSNAKELLQNAVRGNRDRLLRTLHSYKVNKEKVDESFGPVLDDAAKAKIVWLMTNQDQWNARASEYIHKQVTLSGNGDVGSFDDVMSRVAKNEMDIYDETFETTVGLSTSSLINLEAAKLLTKDEYEKSTLKTTLGIEYSDIDKKIEATKKSIEENKEDISVIAATAKTVTNFCTSDDIAKSNMLNFCIQDDEDPSGKKVLYISDEFGELVSDYCDAHQNEISNPKAKDELLDNMETAKKFNMAARQISANIRSEIQASMARKIEEAANKNKGKGKGKNESTEPNKPSEEGKTTTSPTGNEEEHKLEDDEQNVYNDFYKVAITGSVTNVKTLQQERRILDSLKKDDVEKWKNVVKKLLASGKIDSHIKNYILFDAYRDNMMQNRPGLSSQEAEDEYSKMVLTVLSNIKNSQTSDIYEAIETMQPSSKDVSNEAFIEAKNALELYSKNALRDAKKSIGSNINSKYVSYDDIVDVNDDTFKFLTSNLGYSSYLDFLNYVNEQCKKNNIKGGVVEAIKAINKALSYTNHTILTSPYIDESKNIPYPIEEFIDNIFNKISNSSNSEYDKVKQILGDKFESAIKQLISDKASESFGVDTMSRIIDNKVINSLLDTIFGGKYTALSDEDKVARTKMYNTIIKSLDEITRFIMYHTEKQESFRDSKTHEFSVDFLTRTIKKYDDKANNGLGAYKVNAYGDLISIFFDDRCKNLNDEDQHKVSYFFDKVLNNAIDKCASSAYNNAENGADDSNDFSGADDTIYDNINEDGTVIDDKAIDAVTKNEESVNNEEAEQAKNQQDAVKDNSEMIDDSVRYMFYQNSVPETTEDGTLFSTANPEYRSIYDMIDYDFLSKMDLSSPIQFVVLNDYENSKTNDDGEPSRDSSHPTVFMQTIDGNGVAHVIGTIPMSLMKSYYGLSALYDVISKEYAESNDGKNKVASGVFVSSKSCKLQNLLPGKLHYNTNQNGEVVFKKVILDDDKIAEGYSLCLKDKNGIKLPDGISEDQLWSKNAKQTHSGIYVLVPNGFHGGKQMYSMVYAYQCRLEKRDDRKSVRTFLLHFGMSAQEDSAEDASPIGKAIKNTINTLVDDILNGNKEVAIEDFKTNIKKYLYFNGKINVFYNSKTKEGADIPSIVISTLTKGKDNKPVSHQERVFLKDENGNDIDVDVIAATIAEHLRTYRMQVSSDYIHSSNKVTEEEAKQYINDILKSGVLMADLNVNHVYDQRVITQYYDENADNGKGAFLSSEAKQTSGETVGSDGIVKKNNKTQFNDGETKLWVYKSNDTSDEQIKITDENGNDLTAYYVKNQVIKYNIMSSIADGIIISFKSKNYNDTLVMDKNFNYINMTQMRMANDAERKEIDETYREQNNTPSYSQEDIDDDVKEGNKTATKLVEDNKDTKTANESKDGKYHFSDVKEGLGRVHEFECNPSESKQGRSQIDSIATKLYSLRSNQDDLNKYLGSLNEHGFKGIKDSEIKITPTTTIDDIKALLNDYKIPKSSLQIGTETDSVFRQGLAQVKDIINSIMDDKKCSFNEALRELFLNKTYSSKLREVYKRIECTDKNGDSFEYFKNEGGTASASLVSLMGIREDPENAFDNGAKHSPFEQILVDLYLNGAQGFYSDNLAIHGKIGDDDIAGEMDLLVVNSEGSFEVWDYKTVKDAKNKSFNFYKPYNQNDPLIQQYSFQLSSYAQMLEDKYGIDVTSIKIFAIAKEEITGHDIKFSKENNCTIEIPRISKERLDNRARANKANMKVAQTAEEKKEVVAENTENRHKQISKAEAYAMRFPYKLLSNTVIGTNEFFSTQNLFDILTTIDPSISDKINTSVAEGGDMYKIFAAHPELIEFLLEEAKNQIKKQINDINENISSLYEDGDKHKLDIDVDSLLDVNNDDNKQYINDHGILAFVFAANVSVGELINLKCKELNTTLDNLKKHIKPAPKSTEEKVGEVESTEKAEKTEKANEAKPESSNNSNEIEKKVGDAKEVIDFGFNYAYNGQRSIFENKENQQFGSDLRSAHATVDNLLGITNFKDRDGRAIYTIEQTEDPNKYVLNINLSLPMGRGNDYSALSIVLDRNYVINKDDLNLLISKVVDDLHDNMQLQDVIKQLNGIKIRYTKISNPSPDKQHVAPSFSGKTSVYFYNNTVADAVYNLINSKDKNSLISLVADDSNGIVERRKQQLDKESKDYDDLIKKSRNKISDIAKKSGIDNIDELYGQLTNIFSYIDIMKAINGDKSDKNEFKKKYDKIKDSDICDGLVKWLLKSKNQKLAVDYINSSHELDNDTKQQIYLSFEYENLMNYIESKKSNEQQSSNESSEENTQNSEQNNNENSEFEDSFEDDNEDNDDGALLRKEIQGDYVIWDEKKEMEWLKSRLPNLSDKTMVVLRETLINVIKDGNSAWGAFVNGVVYVRSDAAAGTLYHEAFHALYHNILNKEEQLDIMRLARIKFGANLSTIGLEEAVANDFMEYKLKADEAIENRRKFSDKSVFGRFFNKILTIVYAIGDMLTENRSELDEYYRHIDMGFYSKRPIVFTSLSQMKQMERDANRKDGMSYFDTLDRHVQNALKAKGFTREQFDSLSDEEQDDEIMCCK